MNTKEISLFKKVELDSLLCDKNKYKYLLEEKINKNVIESHSNNLILFDAFEEYILKEFKKGSHTSYVKEYASFIYKTFLKYPNTIFDSLFLKDENLPYFYTKNEINDIKSYKNKINIYVTNEIKKVINANKKNTTLTNILLKYAISSIGEDKRVDDIYKYILNNFEYNSSLLSYEFIIKYTAYLTSKEYGIEYIKPYISNYDLDETKIEKNCLGKCFENSGVILIHKNVLKNVKTTFMLSNVIGAVAHEIRHYSQARDFRNNIPSKKTYDWVLFQVFTKYFNSKNIDEYNTNYRNYEIEIDANYNSHDITNKILDKYITNKNNPYIQKALSDKYDTLLLSLTNTKYDIIDKKTKEEIDYNVTTLDRIIKQNPFIINSYPILGYIYNKDGSRRSIYNMVKIESSNKDKKLSDFYREIYLYEINNINNIKLNIYGSDIDKLLLNKILDEEIEEVKELQLIYKYESNIKNNIVNRKNYAIKVNSKTNRINNTIKYINNNIRYIERLNDKTVLYKIKEFNSLIKGLNNSMRMFNINRLLKSDNETHSTLKITLY